MVRGAAGYGRSSCMLRGPQMDPKSWVTAVLPRPFGNAHTPLLPPAVRGSAAPHSPWGLSPRWMGGGGGHGARGSAEGPHCWLRTCAAPGRLCGPAQVGDMSGWNFGSSSRVHVLKLALLQQEDSCPDTLLTSHGLHTRALHMQAGHARGLCGPGLLPPGPGPWLRPALSHADLGGCQVRIRLWQHQ